MLVIGWSPQIKLSLFGVVLFSKFYALVLKLDCEKARDIVGWELFLVMLNGFGHKWIKFIEMVCSKVLSVLESKILMTHMFSGKGLKQGTNYIPFFLI